MSVGVGVGDGDGVAALVLKFSPLPRHINKKLPLSPKRASAGQQTRHKHFRPTAALLFFCGVLCVCVCQRITELCGREGKHGERR